MIREHSLPALHRWPAQVPPLPPASLAPSGTAPAAAPVLEPVVQPVAAPGGDAGLDAVVVSPATHRVEPPVARARIAASSARAGSAAAPAAATPTSAGSPAAASQVAGAPAAIEAQVLTRLLKADLAAGPLLDTIAALSAEALQQAPLGESPASPAALRSTAARIATGLAVALLESDLADRIAARLAEEAPFAEGWRSCPE